MKIKSFWNKKSAPLSPEQLEVERKLLPRLQFMGYIFCLIGVITFVSIFFIEDSAPIYMQPLSEEIRQISNLETEAVLTINLEDSPDELELTATEILNFYYISVVFVGLGAFCFYLVKYKKKELFAKKLH